MNLKFILLSEINRLQRLHTVWLHLYDILEKANWEGWRTQDCGWWREVNKKRDEASQYLGCGGYHTTLHICQTHNCRPKWPHFTRCQFQNDVFHLLTFVTQNHLMSLPCPDLQKCLYMQVPNGKQVISTTSQWLEWGMASKNMEMWEDQAKSPQVVREQGNRVDSCAPAFSLSLSWMLGKARPFIPSNKPTFRWKTSSRAPHTDYPLWRPWQIKG